MFRKRGFWLMLILLLSSPALWLLVSGKYGGAGVISRWPGNAVANIRSIFSAENSQKTDQLHDTNGKNPTDRLFYNKITLMTDTMFSIVSTISPQYLFSPIGRVEVVSLPLLPVFLLWISGVVKKTAILKLLAAAGSAALVLFLTAPDNLILYAVLGLLITYFCLSTFFRLKTDSRITVIATGVLFAYNVYLVSLLGL